MNILFVSSEVVPFAASGGLGDVMGALPKALKSAHPTDLDVSVICPLYSSVSAEWRSKMKLVDEFEFMYGWRHAYCGIFSLALDGVTYLFVDNEQYFMRQAMYGLYDDAERFAYFCRAVIEMMIRLDRPFDILHANDWQSAMTIVYAKTRFADSCNIRGIKTLYTIHNIEYQGKFDKYILGNIFDLETRFLPILEYDGCLNLMKGGIMCADRVSTVSPTYAEEITSPAFAYGLSEIIRDQRGKFCGIINGIDEALYSPSSPDLPCPFGVDDAREGKARNKLALQTELGLSQDPAVPLACMVTRLTHGKGIDLLLHIFDEMMQQNMQFVILGTGDESYERIISGLCARYPGRAKAIIRFDRALSRRIYAAADIFLMPSKSEPCGLAQMIACRLGALPVVRQVGGLADTIIPYGAPGANGFGFRAFNAHELLFTVKDALALYEQHDVWDQLVRSAMTSDFSWNRSAETYYSLYCSIK